MLEVRLRVGRYGMPKTLPVHPGIALSPWGRRPKERPIQEIQSGWVKCIIG
jgi:hypothetical protein